MDERHDTTRTERATVLERVRRLLAQAESTTFPAEAEAFTAKAHELMARYALDTAMLWDRQERGEQPGTLAVHLEHPYVSVKATLLAVVARRSRCRAVHHSGQARSTVVGFEADTAAVEMLFTSLLVQAQSALQAEMAAAPPGSPARSRTFRSSFLLAFAYRVDERMAEINERAERDVDTASGGVLVPVLAARSSAIDDAVEQMFGRLRPLPTRRTIDRLGWHRGRDAADRARLNIADLGA